MTLEWIPRQKSKAQLQNVCPDEEQTCCRRTGGEFWKVYAANGWDVYDDPEYVAGSCHGRGIGPAKYCPACYKKEIGRLTNHRSNNPRWAMFTMAKQQA